MKKQTDANGNRYEMSYNVLGQMLSRMGYIGSTLIEQTDYSYYGNGTGGKINQLQSMNGTTGLSGTNFAYNYDAFGRLTTATTTINSVNYTHNYSSFNQYNDAPTQHEYPSGFKTTTEYSNGFVKEIRNTTNSNEKYFSVAMGNNSYNNYGQVKQYTLHNGLQSTMIYNYGYLTSKTTTGKQMYGLQYDYASGNITNREEYTNLKNETFTYDALDRLKTMQVNGGSIHTMNYNNASGNISSKTDVGNYIYNSSKIHAVERVSNTGNIIPTQTQVITYTAYHQPQTITENDKQLTYTYGPDHERKTMELKQVSTNQVLQRRIYVGDFEIDATNALSPKYVHYINSPAGLVAMVTEENSVRTTYTTYTDHLGSIVTVTNVTGAIVAEQNFDAWGRKRNPTDWTYNNIPSTPWWLYRGYTGHEHLPEFGLINMNGRMYDPVLGRMLSPDNYVQMPNSLQSYNRYSYCLNNPLKYIDPSGEEWENNQPLQGPNNGHYPGEGYFLRFEQTMNSFYQTASQQISQYVSTQIWSKNENIIFSNNSGNNLMAGDILVGTFESTIRENVTKMCESTDRLISTVDEINKEFQKFIDNFLKDNLKGTSLTAVELTVDWALGTGTDNREFRNDEIANSFRDARVTNQARDYWYNQVNAGNKTINDGLTNFLGREALTGGNFGFKGLVSAGLDPMEQFVGSFTPEISSDGFYLTFTIQNTTSFRSLMYGIGPDWLRSTWGPGGNMTQTYIFSEPINFNRIK